MKNMCTWILIHLAAVKRTVIYTSLFFVSVGLEQGHSFLVFLESLLPPAYITRTLTNPTQFDPRNGGGIFLQLVGNVAHWHALPLGKKYVKICRC
jgi:hypothetical protein